MTAHLVYPGLPAVTQAAYKIEKFYLIRDFSAANGEMDIFMFTQVFQL